MPGVVYAFEELQGRAGVPGACAGEPSMLRGGAEGMVRRWVPGRGIHLQFSTRYCTTLSSTFSMSAVRTHMCFKACGLRAGAFPLAEPCLRRASWLLTKGFLQRGVGFRSARVQG